MGLAHLKRKSSVSIGNGADNGHIGELVKGTILRIYALSSSLWKVHKNLVLIRGTTGMSQADKAVTFQFLLSTIMPQKDDSN